MKTTTLLLKNSMNRSSLRRGFFLNALVLAVAWFAFSPLANGQCPQVCDLNANTALGNGALMNNTEGRQNTATGVAALGHNTSGSFNTVAGFRALDSNTTGHDNIALGNKAGNNISMGSFNIDIGNPSVGDESNTIRIGLQQTNTYIGGISGATVPTGVAVIVDSSGHLGTITSSARFKDAIKPMDKASEAILALQTGDFPVQA